MPNRYEREIEEILRNLEPAKPGSHFRPSSRSRRRTALRFSLPEWLLWCALGAALLGGGYAYLFRPDFFSTVLALAGALCLLLVGLSSWLFRPRGPRSVQYGNITITPLRRGPIDTIKTRWNLLLMKWHYRRKRP